MMQDENWSNEFSKAHLKSLRFRMIDFLSDAPPKLPSEAWEYLSLFAQFLCAATDENAKEISNICILVEKAS